MVYADKKLEEVFQSLNDASLSQLEDRWMLMYIGICPRYTEKLLSISSDELGLLINGYLPTTIDKEKFSVLLKTMLDNENYYYEFNKNNDSLLGYTPLKEVVDIIDLDVEWKFTITLKNKLLNQTLRLKEEQIDISDAIFEKNDESFASNFKNILEEELEKSDYEINVDSLKRFRKKIVKDPEIKNKNEDNSYKILDAHKLSGPLSFNNERRHYITEHIQYDLNSKDAHNLLPKAS